VEERVIYLYQERIDRGRRSGRQKRGSEMAPGMGIEENRKEVLAEKILAAGDLHDNQCTSDRREGGKEE